MPPLLLLLLLLLLLVVEPALIVAPLPPGTHEPDVRRDCGVPGRRSATMPCLVLERRFVARLWRKTRIFHLDGDDGKFDTTPTNKMFTTRACHAPFLNVASHE